MTRKQVAMTAAEKAARDVLIAAEWVGRIADRRYAAETSGTVVSGHADRHRRPQQDTHQCCCALGVPKNDYVLRWKNSEGFVDLPAVQVLAIADAVSEHVQLCFDREDALLVAVGDGAITAEMVEEGGLIKKL